MLRVLLNLVLGLSRVLGDVWICRESWRVSTLLGQFAMWLWWLWKWRSANFADWVNLNYGWFDLARDRPTTGEKLEL